MAIDTNVTTQNPYRTGSKLHTIFNFIADGEAHTLEAIADAAYFPGAGRVAIRRCRTASALRTIRYQPGVFVDYCETTKTYRLVETRLSNRRLRRRVS